MTATEAAAVEALYDAAGVVARELGPVIDALEAVPNVPLVDVLAVVDAATTRLRRAYAVTAAVRERFG